MSRTRKGSKAPGYDYWSARPGNRHGALGYGPYAKRRTHRLERQSGKKTTRADLTDV